MANKVLPQHVEDLVFFSEKTTVAKVGDKTTVVTVKLPNGYEMIGIASCVDPVNYNEEIGKQVALNNIKDDLWPLLGFLLQTSPEEYQKLIEKAQLKKE